MTFGARIRAAREALGLTQSDVAVDQKVSQATVSDWERGQTTPTLMRVAGLAELLQLDRRELLEALVEHTTEPAEDVA